MSDDRVDAVTVMLATAQVFRPLALAEVGIIRRSAREHHLGAGQPITGEGEADDRFYVIVAGTARVTTRSGASVRLGAGDHFGEIASYDGAPRSGTVTAESDVHLVSLSRVKLRLLVREHPDIALGVMQGLCTLARLGPTEVPPVTSPGGTTR
jgi:CRP/FNR family transcriptional regulator